MSCDTEKQLHAMGQATQAYIYRHCLLELALEWGAGPSKWGTEDPTYPMKSTC